MRSFLLKKSLSNLEVAILVAFAIWLFSTNPSIPLVFLVAVVISLIGGFIDYFYRA